jgi:hypothetical protein
MLEAFIIMKLLNTYIVISLHENTKPGHHAITYS